MHRLRDLSERSRWLFEAVVESVFISAGDEDYVAARVLWENGLMRGFAWHAAQAAEKYTKAASLMNDLDAKFGHNFAKSLEALADAFPELMPNRIEKPENYLHQELDDFSEELLVFAKRLEVLGTPDSRYLETELRTSPCDLVKFDILCKVIRRMTIDLNELHGERPARAWLADDPDQISRPFFSEPSLPDTKSILEKGNFGFSQNPKQQPSPHYTRSLSGMVRAQEIDHDVIQTAKFFASKTKWKEKYFLERVVIG